MTGLGGRHVGMGRMKAGSGEGLFTLGQEAFTVLSRNLKALTSPGRFVFSCSPMSLAVCLTSSL